MRAVSKSWRSRSVLSTQRIRSRPKRSAKRPLPLKPTPCACVTPSSAAGTFSLALALSRQAANNRECFGRCAEPTAFRPCVVATATANLRITGSAGGRASTQSPRTGHILRILAACLIGRPLSGAQYRHCQRARLRMSNPRHPPLERRTTSTAGAFPNASGLVRFITEAPTFTGTRLPSQVFIHSLVASPSNCDRFAVNRDPST